MPNYKRARVALTAVPSSLDRAPILHVGHARTILIGSLIAEKVGCPFHVRIDGVRIKESGQGAVDFILSVRELLRFLDIDCPTYWHAQFALERKELTQVPGVDVRVLDAYALFAETVSPATRHEVEDDMVTHAPSLIVRGMEFTDPARWMPTDAGISMGRHIKAEQDLYDILGVPKHEVNLPLVLSGGNKMSKSGANPIGWELLKMVEGTSAREYLKATLLCPDSPMSALGETFSMTWPPRHHEWDWASWSALVKRAC